jgi:spore coat protein CotH
MVLSHWDGYFNNYLTYHDPKTGKWEMYPWDQDKTWGYYDGIGRDEVFTDMPLTNGMEGDVAPGGQFGGFFGGGGVAWWRRGGYFSRPLLANPQFRKVFLARVREIIEKVYTPEIYGPVLDALADRLREDVELRGRAFGRNAAGSASELAHNVTSLKTHLEKRRAFLLAQAELSEPGTPTSPPVVPAGNAR